jgi:uncharacterized membrane protein
VLSCQVFLNQHSTAQLVLSPTTHIFECQQVLRLGKVPSLVGTAAAAAAAAAKVTQWPVYISLFGIDLLWSTAASDIVTPTSTAVVQTAVTG